MVQDANSSTWLFPGFRLHLCYGGLSLQVLWMKGWVIFYSVHPLGKPKRSLSPRASSLEDCQIFILSLLITLATQQEGMRHVAQFAQSASCQQPGQDHPSVYAFCFIIVGSSFREVAEITRALAFFPFLRPFSCSFAHCLTLHSDLPLVPERSQCGWAQAEAGSLVI